MGETKYQGFKDLIVYQKAFKLSMLVFHMTKSFPKEEKYALSIYYILLTTYFKIEKCGETYFGGKKKVGSK